MKIMHIKVRSQPPITTFALTMSFLLLLFTPFSNGAFGAVYTLYPIEGASADSEQPKRPFPATDWPIFVWKYAEDEHRGYLKFNLSPISDEEVITSVTFIARTSSVSQFSAPFPIDILHVSRDSWRSETLTWRKKPKTDDLLGSLNFDADFDTGPCAFCNAWDLSGYDYYRDQQDGTLSLAIVSRDPVGTGVAFSFLADSVPYLVVETGPAP